MGNWTVVISGVGAHHNDKESDADKIARAVVKTLKENGHDIKLSTFTYGAMSELVPPEESNLCNSGELMRLYKDRRGEPWEDNAT